MNTKADELSHADLGEVIGGLRNYPILPPTPVSSAPVVIPIIPIPVPTRGPFTAPGSGILER